MKRIYKVTVEFKVTVDDDEFDTDAEHVDNIRSSIEAGLKLPGYMTRGMDVEMYVPVRVTKAA